MFISLYSKKEFSFRNSTSLTPFTFFHTQTHPSGNAAATTCQYIAKTRCSKTACPLFFLLHLGCIFALKLLKQIFQKIWKIHNSTNQTVCIKQGSCFILMTTFFEQWAACLCSSNLQKIWGKNWPAHIPFQIIATASQCSMVCAEKIKQNTVISATHTTVHPLENCTLKMLEDTYNCSEDHESKKIHEAKCKALLKAQKRERN